MNQKKLSKDLERWWRKTDIGEFGAESQEVLGFQKDYQPLTSKLAEVIIAVGLSEKETKTMYQEAIYYFYFSDRMKEVDMLFNAICQYYYNGKDAKMERLI